jgi:outer membrane protein
MRVIVKLMMLLLPAGVMAQQNKMSLAQCIDTALKNNFQVKQASLQVQAATVNLSQARANLLPDLNGNFGYGFNQGRNVDPLTNSYINQQLASSNIGLNSGIVLFNGMRLQNLITQNRFSQQAANMDLQQTKDNLTLNVILAYLQVLSNEDVLQINKEQYAVTGKQVERMGILVREGASANYLLADLKGQQANEKITIVNAENLLQQSKLSLCQLMNIDYNSDLSLEKSGIDLLPEKYADDASTVYQKAQQNFALIKANDLKVKTAAAAVKAERSVFFPLVSLNAALGSSYSSLAQTLTPVNVTEVQTGSYVLINGNPNNVLKQQQNFSAAKTGYTKQLNNNLGSFAGVNIQVPLFNNFQTKNRVKLAKINLTNTQIQTDYAKLQLKQNIEQAYLNSNASFERYKILTEQVKDFEESFRAAEIRFSNGVINSAEYLISKNNLDRVRIQFTQTKYDYSFRTKLLDYYQGKQ